MYFLTQKIEKVRQVAKSRQESIISHMPEGQCDHPTLVLPALLASTRASQCGGRELGIATVSTYRLKSDAMVASDVVE